MDYRLLLWKYICRIVECEGISFIPPGGDCVLPPLSGNTP